MQVIFVPFFSCRRSGVRTPNLDHQKSEIRTQPQPSLEKRELIKHQKVKTTHFLPAVQRHGQEVLKRMERGGGGVD